VAMGTRFLLTSDSTVPNDVKRRYLESGLDGTVVSTRVDGMPHRVLRTGLVEKLESGSRVRGFTAAVGNAQKFKKLSGMTWRSMVKDGLAMRHGKDLTWSQVVMAANTPMLLKAGLVEGNTDAGVLASGQVAGILDDLPSCAELIDGIVSGAVAWFIHLFYSSLYVEGLINELTTFAAFTALLVFLLSIAGVTIGRWLVDRHAPEVTRHGGAHEDERADTDVFAAVRNPDDDETAESEQHTRQDGDETVEGRRAH